MSQLEVVVKSCTYADRLLQAKLLDVLRRKAMIFELPPLPYGYSALEPFIDTQTMHLHHDKHHAAYVNNLNNALQTTAFAHMSVDELVGQINRVPDNIRTAVQNNAGGHSNHSLFWRIMKPNGGGPPIGE